MNEHIWPLYHSRPAEVVEAEAAAAKAEDPMRLLIEELRASAAASRELAEAVRMLAQAVHAQAAAIAAAVGEDTDTGDAAPMPADPSAPHGRYVDGEAIGG